MLLKIKRYDGSSKKKNIRQEYEQFVFDLIKRAVVAPSPFL